MKKEYPKNFIRVLREEADLSVKDLAALIGTSGPYVTMLERSQRRLYQDWVHKIAAALGRHPSEITDGPGCAVMARNDIERNILLTVRRMEDEGQAVYSVAKVLAEQQEKATKDIHSQ